MIEEHIKFKKYKQSHTENVVSKRESDKSGYVIAK